MTYQATGNMTGMRPFGYDQEKPIQNHYGDESERHPGHDGSRAYLAIWSIYQSALAGKTCQRSRRDSLDLCIISLVHMHVILHPQASRRR
jgi:hypothetical protein